MSMSIDPAGAIHNEPRRPKEASCPEWCVADHDGQPEGGADGYTCHTATTTLALPRATGGTVLNRSSSISLRRAQFTVEPSSVAAGWSTAQSIEVTVNDRIEPIDLTSEEALQLATLLTFHAGQMGRTP